MTRPPAIRRFEALYAGSTAAWLLGAALSWDERQRMIAETPALAGYEWLVPAGFALVLVVSAVLWWQAARRGEILARTGVAGVAVLSTIVIVLTLVGLVSGRVLSWPASLLQLVASTLSIWGAATLFRDDARVWFGEPAVDGTDA